MEKKDNEAKLQKEVLAVKNEDRAVIMAPGSGPPLPLVRGKNVYTDEEIAGWKVEIMKKHPSIPENILNTTLDAFQTHPDIFDKMMREFKANPDVYKHHEATYTEMFPNVDCNIEDPKPKPIKVKA